MMVILFLNYKLYQQYHIAKFFVYYSVRCERYIAVRDQEIGMIRRLLRQMNIFDSRVAFTAENGIYI